MADKKMSQFSKYAKILLALTWAIFIFMLLSSPMPVSQEYVFTWYDKFIHSLLFGIMAYLFFETAYYEFNQTFYKSIKFSGAFSLIYILIMEFMQNFFPGRTPDIFDSLAGFTGVFLNILYLYSYPPKKKPRLLLHICCIGCGLHIIERLSKDFSVDLFYFNPNIFPHKEYQKRFDDVKRISGEFGMELIEGAYNHKKWLESVKGLAGEKEGQERCRICYAYRLDETARTAKEKCYGYFTTTLSISPHKDSQKINHEGMLAGKRYKTRFIAEDFKSGRGFEKNLELSRQHSVYRQKYCGCEFSDTYKPAKSKLKK